MVHLCLIRTSHPHPTLLRFPNFPSHPDTMRGQCSAADWSHLDLLVAILVDAVIGSGPIIEVRLDPQLFEIKYAGWKAQSETSGIQCR